MKKLRNYSLNIFLIMAVLLGSIITLQPQLAKAATFTKYYVFLDKIEASTGTGGTVCVQPATTSASNNDVKISWPTGYTVSGTTSNWTASTSNIPLSINGSTPLAWPGITAATVSVSGQSVTYTYSGAQNLTNSNIYCFRFTNSSALTTPAATSGSVNTGTITTEASGPSTIDTGNFGMAIVSGTNDQISVSSTVSPTFNFAL